MHNYFISVAFHKLMYIFSDDDNYIKNKKVTKKKLKTYDEDHNIFLLFGCEKPCKY